MSNALVDFDQVKSQVAIVDVARDMLNIAGALQPDGKYRAKVCPFCGQQRSFLVTPNGGRDGKGLAGCFRCPKKGLDAIGLVKVAKGYKDMREAALAIVEHFGSRTVPETRNSTVPQEQKPRTNSATTFDAEAYGAKLLTEHEAVEPLGLAADTLKAWKAGYCTSGVNRGTLALPVHRNGTVIAYIGRGMDGTVKFPPGFKPEEHIFGLHLIDGGEVRLLRDTLDVLHAYQMDEPAICFLTELIESSQWELLLAAQDTKNFKTIL